MCSSIAIMVIEGSIQISVVEPPEPEKIPTPPPATPEEVSLLIGKLVHDYEDDIDGLTQNCSNSIANALELLQSCTKPSILYSLVSLIHELRLDDPHQLT